jgi:hypothetical protein
MIKLVDVQTCEQIKEKIRTGDFITLGEILKISTDNARMRFHRRRQDAVDAMERIVVSREALTGTEMLP